MQALVLDAGLKTAQPTTEPVPSPRSGEVLVRVHAIALNPVDALYVYKPIGNSGRTVGSDFAGVVESPSSDSVEQQLRPGSRVAGFLQGACSVNDRPGAFAELLTCPGDLLWRVPDSMPLENAAAISLCALTAAQALFYRLGLLAPFVWDDVRAGGTKPVILSSKLNFFIYGASTSVGMYAAQLLRRSSEAHGTPINLIGAASKARFEMLRASPFAYDALVDYRDQDWPEQVRRHTQGKGVDLAYDCISEGLTVGKICDLLADDGRIAVVRSKEYGAWEKSDVTERVQPIYGAVWEGLGEEVEYNNTVLQASPQARSFATAFYRWLSETLQIEANPVRLMPGGLERVFPDGLRLLGANSMTAAEKGRPEHHMKPISAEKLVYNIKP